MNSLQVGFVVELDQHRSYFFYLFIFLRRPLKFLFRPFAEGEGDNTNGWHDFRVHLRTVPTVVIDHTFCAFRNNSSQRWCLLIQ